MGRDDLAERRGLDGQVYQPAEDSDLLARAAVAWIDGDERVLDVGTGSGYVADRVREATGAAVVASDLNPHACRAARERGLAVVRGDLVEPFADGTFDAAVCNPPYLPTDPEAAWDDWVERALSGGASGRAVLAPLVRSVGRVLAPGGAVYLLVSSLAGVDEVADLAREVGFAVERVAEESFPFETLVVLRLTLG